MQYHKYITSIMKKASLFFTTIFFPTSDSAVATPINNFEVIEKFINQNYTPYDDIYSSPYSPEVLGGVGGATLMAVLFKLVTLLYQRDRRTEKDSHYFYFLRLINSPSCDLILGLKTSHIIKPSILNSYLYFYNPDVSPITLRFRRLFCYGKQRKEFKALQRYLWDRMHGEGKTRKAITQEINKEIMTRLVNFLNLYGSSASIFSLKKSELKSEFDELKTGDKKTLLKFRLVKDKSNADTIGLTEEFWKEYLKNNPYKKEEVAKKTKWQRFESLLGDLGQASFIYWIFVFVFYLIPGFAVVAGIVVPPLGIALGALGLKWLYKAYSSWKTNRQQQTINGEVIHRNKEELSIIGEVERQALLENLFPLQSEKRVRFENSKLMRELDGVVNKKGFRLLSFFKASREGFINACFLPFFVGWLFTDLAKLVGGLIIGTPLIFNPMTLAIIGGVTLGFGLIYGVYRAVHCFKAEKSKYAELVDKIKVLKDELAGVEIPNLSLSEYDHFIRRLTVEKYFSTRVKKFFNRVWAAFKALGTGGLVFRLVILGSLVSFGLSFPPFIVVSFIAVFAVEFAIWAWRSYSLKSRLKQVGAVVDYLTQFKHRLKLEQSLDNAKNKLQFQPSPDRSKQGNSLPLILDERNTLLVSKESKKNNENELISASYRKLHQSILREDLIPTPRSVVFLAQNAEEVRKIEEKNLLSQNQHLGSGHISDSEQVAAAIATTSGTTRNRKVDNALKNSLSADEGNKKSLLKNDLEPIPRKRAYTDSMIIRNRTKKALLEKRVEEKVAKMPHPVAATPKTITNFFGPSSASVSHLSETKNNLTGDSLIPPKISRSLSGSSRSLA